MVSIDWKADQGFFLNLTDEYSYTLTLASSILIYCTYLHSEINLLCEVLIIWVISKTGPNKDKHLYRL